MEVWLIWGPDAFGWQMKRVWACGTLLLSLWGLTLTLGGQDGIERNRDWVTLPYSRNWHNVVNQLQFSENNMNFFFLNKGIELDYRTPVGVQRIRELVVTVGKYSRNVLWH